MSGTVIKRCTCVSAFQDARYGAGMRVFNIGKDPSILGCTVCGGNRLIKRMQAHAAMFKPMGGKK